MHRAARAGAAGQGSECGVNFFSLVDRRSKVQRVAPFCPVLPSRAKKILPPHPRGPKKIVRPHGIDAPKKNRSVAQADRIKKSILPKHRVLEFFIMAQQLGMESPEQQGGAAPRVRRSSRQKSSPCAPLAKDQCGKGQYAYCNWAEALDPNRPLRQFAKGGGFTTKQGQCRAAPGFAKSMGANVRSRSKGWCPKEWAKGKGPCDFPCFKSKFDSGQFAGQQFCRGPPGYVKYGSRGGRTGWQAAGAADVGGLESATLLQELQDRGYDVRAVGQGRARRA